MTTEQDISSSTLKIGYHFYLYNARPFPHLKNINRVSTQSQTRLFLGRPAFFFSARLLADAPIPPMATSWVGVATAGVTSPLLWQFIAVSRQPEG
jgi:hypothetical protein